MSDPRTRHVGLCEARCVCPAHPTAAMLRYGPYLARCVACQRDVRLCATRVEDLECVLEARHEGEHVARAGTRFPLTADERADLALYAKWRGEVDRG